MSDEGSWRKPLALLARKKAVGLTQTAFMNNQIFDPLELSQDISKVCA